MKKSEIAEFMESMEEVGDNWTEEQCAFLNVSRNIVRIHCGLEGTENLIADLQQALDKIS